MKKLIITSLILTILYTAQLSAQRYAAEDGHLLDANNRIGSMGWNGNARMDALSYRNNSMMTGNLTGGVSFQGQMPYSSSQQFQGLSKSDTLSNFRRDSRNVSSLGMSGPQVYIDQTRGVAGSYRPGGSASYQGYSTSSIINPRSSRTYSQQYSNSLNYRPQSSGNFSLDKYIGQNTISSNPFSRSSGPAGIASEALGRTGIGFSLSTNNNNLTFSRKFQPKKEIVETPDQTLLNIQTEEVGNTEISTAKPPVDIEEQMYLDSDAPKRIFAEGQQMQSSGLTDQDDITDQMKARYIKYMTEGKKELKNGKYYNAVDAFELAKIYSGRNSLEPLFNCMAARLAAGEYISAASNLYNMFYISFDQTLQKRDIQIIFDSNSVAGDSLRELSNSYNTSKNSSLLFLKGYIQYLNNDLDEATLSYIELVKIDPKNELFGKILAALREQRDADRIK